MSCLRSYGFVAKKSNFTLIENKSMMNNDNMLAIVIHLILKYIRRYNFEMQLFTQNNHILYGLSAI